MDQTRLIIIFGMALVTYLLRIIPQLLLLGESFPRALDRYLRYLSYTLIVSIISTSLFLSGGSFDAGAFPHRIFALVAAILVALWSRSILLGMFTGTLLVLALPWLG